MIPQWVLFAVGGAVVGWLLVTVTFISKYLLDIRSLLQQEQDDRRRERRQSSLYFTYGSNSPYEMPISTVSEDQRDDA